MSSPDPTGQPPIPQPHAAIVERARQARDDEAAFWRAIYYLADGALLYGRGDDAIAALARAARP